MPNQKFPRMGVNPSAPSVRHAHDLSGTRTYSQPIGMMLPIYHQSLNPREAVNLSVFSNTQMMTLKGRAFTSFRQRFAAFFVKNHDMWSFWDSFITNIPVNNTSHSSKIVYPTTLSGTGSTTLPKMVGNYNVLPASAPVANVYATTRYLLEHYYFMKVLIDFKIFELNSDSAKTFWTYFQSAFASSNTPQTFTFDNTSQHSIISAHTFMPLIDICGFDIGPSAARLCEMLGYGSVKLGSIAWRYIYDLYLLSSSGYDAFYSYFDANRSVLNQIFGNTDFIKHTDDGYYYDFHTLIVDNIALFTAPSTLDRKRNLFPLVSYHKIYNDFFRNEDFEPFEPLVNNLDYFFDSNGLTTDLSYDWKTKIPSNPDVFYNPISVLAENNLTLIKLLMPHYAHFGQDVITNVKPSPLYTFATPSLPSDLLGKYSGLIGTFTGVQNASPNTGIDAVYGNTITSGTGVVQLPDANVSFAQSSGQLTPQTLRGLFALEKIAKLSASARRSYSEQIRAVYGVSPDYDNHSSMFIGSVRGQAHVTPLICQSDGMTSDSSTNFGQQSGFVDGRTEGILCNNFVAPDFGELIVMTWIECSAPFDADFVDPLVSKIRPADYFHPQFADLGMQPLLTETIDQALTASIGFQVRYAEYKQGRDVVFGDFQSNRNKSFMTTHRLPKPRTFISIGGTPYPYETSLDVLSYQQNTPIENYPHNKVGYSSLFLISPAVTNPICEVNYDGNTDTDPVDVFTNITCFINRDMSENGEPLI